MKNRSFNETLLNHTSSRSHCLFKINIWLSYKSDSSAIEYSIPILVVDLAGSERVKRIDNGGVSPLMTETCNINKSLLVLGRCLKSMAYNSGGCNNNNLVSPQASPFKSQLIPYRDSKLTKILFEYFMDNSNISMIVNLNLNPLDYDENVRVLDYAAFAKQIQPIKSTLNNKWGLVSEKKQKINENDAEQEKKIQRLEEIISNLNDQILINKLLGKYEKIMNAFYQENDRIFALERYDIQRFSSYNEIFTVNIFSKNIKRPSQTQEFSVLDKEDLQSFLGHKDEITLDNISSKKIVESKEIGLNTSPNFFVFKNSTVSEKMTSPIIFNDQNQEKCSISIVDEESSVLTNINLDSFGENLPVRKKKKKVKKPKRRNDKENDSFAINSKKEKQKKKKETVFKSSPIKIEENLEEEDHESDQEDCCNENNLDCYMYSSIKKNIINSLLNKEGWNRDTPIMKRLRSRPNPKKHNCF